MGTRPAKLKRMENSCRKISKPSTKTSKSRKKHKRHCESPNSDDSDFELLASSDGSRHRKKKHQEKKDSKRKKKRKERARDSASVHGEHAGHMSKQSTTAASTSKEAPRPVHAVTEIDMAKLKATLVAQTSKLVILAAVPTKQDLPPYYTLYTGCALCTNIKLPSASSLFGKCL